MKQKFTIFAILSIILTLAFAAAGVTPARAASVWVVTKTMDTNDGICNSDCSLREAIAVAVAGDTITFASSLSGQTIRLSSSLTIDRSLTIDGSSLASPVQLNGDTDNNGYGNVRVINVNPGVTANLKNLVITKGYDLSGGGPGGGIYNLAGNLTVTNVTFNGNTSLSPTNGYGGAIFSDSGTLTVISSTFTGNAVSKDGGAIYSASNPAIVVNSTFYLNYASSGNGAAIYNYWNAYLTNNTLVGNGGNGAFYNANTAYVRNTIMTSTAYGPDCVGNPFSTNTNNLIVSRSGCSVPAYTTTANMGTLASNGGPTQTIAPLQGSSAINTGDNATCAGAIGAPNYGAGGADQRGVTRPQSATCDIGAYEQELPSATTDAATSVTSSGATLNSTVNANYGSTGAFFQYGLTTNYSASIGADPNPVSGSTNTVVSKAVTGLAYDTTYHYRVVAGNSAGTIIGSDRTFTTSHLIGIQYVKPIASGLGNCSSWANACILQTALTNAVSGDEIWVMQGTYKPTSGADLTATFQLKSGVTVYGGFAGTETARAQRQSSLYNATILSGDIGVVGNKSDNSYHVVIGASNAVLDGFTITAGNAYGIDAYSNGGGMYNYNTSSLTVTNITFSDNSASSLGGGMYNYNNSSLTVTNVTFSDNSANFGGGMYNEGNNPTITNAIFSNNSASLGGGMYNKSASPLVTNVTFSGNSATSSGGGMLNYYYSSPQVTNATFSDNSANNGGGMYNVTESNPIIANATFSGNSANIYGGGVFNESNPTLINVTFSGNSADQGGGIYNFFYGSPVLKNVLIANSSGGDCALEYRALNSASANNLIEDSSSACGLSNGDGKGSIVGVTPMLGAPGNYGGSTQTIPLLPGSPAIDAGNDAFCAATPVDSHDQRGVTRPKGSHCDIGAVEMDPSTFHTISGTVGVGGVTVDYGAAATSSDTDGSYSFQVYDGWSGTITPSRTGYTFTPGNRSYDNITADQNVPGFTADINSYTLTYTAGANGSITGTSPQTVNHGANGSEVTAVPDTSSPSKLNL